MIHYFKTKWEENRLQEQVDHNDNIEDVVENMNGVSQGWVANEFNGSDTTVLN